MPRIANYKRTAFNLVLLIKQLIIRTIERYCTLQRLLTETPHCKNNWETPFITKTIEMRYTLRPGTLPPISTWQIKRTRGGEQLRFTTTRRVRRQLRTAPDTRLEGHLGRRTARDHSLVVQHKF